MMIIKTLSMFQALIQHCPVVVSDTVNFSSVMILFSDRFYSSFIDVICVLYFRATDSSPGASV